MKRPHLIAALALLALAAAMMHAKIHPPSEGSNGLNFPNTLAFLLCLTDLFIVTLLFCFRGTVGLAAMINGMIAVYGSVIMIHYGLTYGQVSAHIPHVAIAAADTLVGIALLRVTLTSLRRPS